jgi:hypothetical protein
MLLGHSACGARLQNFTHTGFPNQHWNSTQRAVVVGAAGLRWGETTTTENWFEHSYPALSGQAEALWGTEQQTQPTQRNLSSAEQRLRRVLCRMIRTGAAQPFNATAMGPAQRVDVPWQPAGFAGGEGFAFCHGAPLPPPQPTPTPSPPAPPTPPPPAPINGSNCTAIAVRRGGPVIGTTSITGAAGSTAAACCSSCDADPRCVAFTLSIDASKRTCWLKNNLQNGSTCAHVQCISGTKVAAAAAAAAAAMATTTRVSIKTEDDVLQTACCHFSYATEHSYSSVKLDRVQTRDTWYLNGDTIGCGHNYSIEAFVAMSEDELRRRLHEYMAHGYGQNMSDGFDTTNALILDVEAPVGLKLLGRLLSAERRTNSTSFSSVVAAFVRRAKVVQHAFPYAKIGFYGSPNAPDSYADEKYAEFRAGLLEAARRGLFSSADFLLPVLYFGANVTSPSHVKQVQGWTNQSLGLAHELAVAAQHRGSLPIFINTKFTYHSGEWLEASTVHRLIKLWRATSTVERIIFWYYPDDQLSERGLPSLEAIEAWWSSANVVPKECSSNKQ